MKLGSSGLQAPRERWLLTSKRQAISLSQEAALLNTVLGEGLSSHTYFSCFLVLWGKCASAQGQGVNYLLPALNVVLTVIFQYQKSSTPIGQEPSRSWSREVGDRLLSSLFRFFFDQQVLLRCREHDPHWRMQWQIKKNNNCFLFYLRPIPITRPELQLQQEDWLWNVRPLTLTVFPHDSVETQQMSGPMFAQTRAGCHPAPKLLRGFVECLFGQVWFGCS